MRGHTKTLLIGAALLVVLISPSSAAQRDSREPIIDMHLHAIPWTPKIGQAETPQDFTKGWEETRQWLDRYNIVLGLVSGSNEITQHWKRLAPERIQAGVFFPCDHGEVANSRDGSVSATERPFPTWDGCGRRSSLAALPFWAR